MAKDFAIQFYNSNKWKRSRAAYIATRVTIDGGMCETCGEVPGFIVHHKIRLTAENINDPEITLNHQYFKYDCLTCHNKEEANRTAENKYFFTDDGDICPIPPIEKKIF